MVHSIAIIGAAGYAGGELVRLADEHPGLSIAHLGGHTSSGRRLGDVHPHLAGADRRLESSDPTEIPEVDLAFLALPHGASATLGTALWERGVKVVDLGSDFRLHDPQTYRRAYSQSHPFPDQLGSWVFGLPEFFADAIAKSSRTAVPGCYPTAAVLALAPLLRDQLIASSGIKVDALSGVSGAGRAIREDLLFGSIDEGVAAYGVTDHRHRPEMEQALGEIGGVAASVTFTPHLVPMHRGILATCYATINPATDLGALRHSLLNAYAAAPFVDLVETSPNTRWVVGSNRCQIAVFLDVSTGTAVVISAIDNLLKGAAGNAVQCANLMLGLDETAGLPMAGWMA